MLGVTHVAKQETFSEVPSGQDGAGLRFSVACPGKEADKREAVKTLVSGGVGRKQPLLLVS